MDQFTLAHKSTGLTITEQHLSRLGDQAFLKAWAYANTFRKQGKELCDLLVVFDNNIIIFQDKNIHYPTTSSQEINWNRWQHKAVEQAIKQLCQAERHIRQFPQQIFLDATCKTPLPVKIPSQFRIYRVVIASGARVPCKNFFPTNISGSLLVNYNRINSRVHSNAPTPLFSLFFLHSPVVHVFDNYNLNILLSHLDTIADFINYLQAKEDLITSKLTVTYCAEEDLLAEYFKGYSPQTRTYGFDQYINSPAIALSFGEGSWEQFVKYPQYVLKKKEDKISYVWDQLINNLVQNYDCGETISPRPFDPLKEGPLFEMAKEPRLYRRILAKALLQAIHEYSSNYTRLVRIMPSSVAKQGYMFLQLALDWKDLERKADYPAMRMEFLKCLIVAFWERCPLYDKIIGIVTEPPRLKEPIFPAGVGLWRREDFTKEERAYYLAKAKELGLFTRTTSYAWHEEDFPRVSPLKKTHP